MDEGSHSEYIFAIVSCNVEGNGPSFGNIAKYIDLDLRTRKIINWDYDQRDNLVQELAEPYQRVFITKGQYNKLEMKNLEIQKY